MKKILVTYATNAGSTAEVALTIGEEIRKSGAQVYCRSKT
jgi:flavodoxin